MKKLAKKILSVMIVVTMFLSASVTAFAAEEINSQADGLYIATQPVPDEAVSYAQNSIGGMIQDIYDLNTVTVGQPFTVEGHSCDLYYFLIYSNNELVGSYRVFDTENGYTGIFSENEELLDGFNEMRSLTSAGNPAKIVVGEYEDMYAVTADEIISILTDPEGRTTELVNGIAYSYLANEALDVVNASEGISITVPEETLSDSNSGYKYLQIGWAETQGNLPWCAAFATASICRYVTQNSDIKARTVMKYTYPDVTNSELEEKALSHAQVISYGKSLGLSPRMSIFRLSWSNVKEEIDGERPVYFACDNVSEGKSAHALVCRGYSENNGNPFYSIWNPWYNKFEGMYTSNYIYTADTGEQFKYVNAIYNWK